MWLTEKLTTYRAAARLNQPAHELALGTGAARRKRVISVGVLALLELNEWLICRFQPDIPARWDPARWPWIAEIERQAPTIKLELERYLAGGPIPLVVEVAGFDPDSEGGRASVPVRVGEWRSLMLYVNGAWVEATAQHFPTTRACFAQVNPKGNVGFGAIEGHTHITAHVDSNRGALRVGVPIIVPGEPGDCRIRIADELLDWTEGVAMVFDVKAEHEAWNDTDEIRVVLMAEIPLPLRWPMSWVNRAAQHSMRWHHSYRQLPERIAGFGHDHDAVAARRASPS